MSTFLVLLVLTFLGTLFYNVYKLLASVTFTKTLEIEIPKEEQISVVKSVTTSLPPTTSFPRYLCSLRRIDQFPNDPVLRIEYLGDGESKDIRILRFDPHDDTLNKQILTNVVKEAQGKGYHVECNSNLNHITLN